MYKIYCDTYPLLDTRDDALIVENPKAKLAVNTVGEASFTIYSDHPYYSNLKKLRSCIEISDEYGVLFRGRITNDSRDFNNKKVVDVEGAMAFFNDSIVRPFNFPDDFLNDSAYTVAAESGNVVAFFLNWLITQHNSQVQDFQRFKLGNVTVSDPNNYLSRSDTEYKKTWDILKGKLFDSALGGFICIRYEADGNYIDYLSEFTEENSQGIEFGENLLDIKHDSDANETYTAILPLGAETDGVRLTLSSYPDGDITSDLVKEGDTLYSRSAVADKGWIYAPTSETTWNDVTKVENLLKNSKEYLTNTAVMFSDTVEISAVDLHFEDSKIRSFRIYKNVAVNSAPHNLSATYQLTELDLDLMNPQNTKIVVGKTSKTLTDVQNQQYNALQKINADYQEVKKNYVTNEVLISEITKTQSLISQQEEEILLKVSAQCVTTTNFDTYKTATAAEIGLKVGRNEYNQIVSMINMSSNWINIAGSRLTISSDYFALDADGTIIAQAGEIGGCEMVDGVLQIKNANADGIKAKDVDITGTITASKGKIGAWAIYESGILGSTAQGADGAIYGIALDARAENFDGSWGDTAVRSVLAIGNFPNGAEGAWDYANFRVQADGTLKAKNVEIEGTFKSAFKSSTTEIKGGWLCVDAPYKVHHDIYHKYQLMQFKDFMGRKFALYVYGSLAENETFDFIYSGIGVEKV